MASQPIASTAITSFSFDSFIRGYHAYMDNHVCKKVGGAGRNARSQRIAGRQLGQKMWP